ncbi:MBG domain-containing protein, partial [Belliella aquatica]
SGVGTYPITLTGGFDPNYDISLADGVLEVTKASLTITADDKDKVYGSENPSLTFTYVGLVNGDTKVVTEPSITTTATVSSGVGTYPITLTGGFDPNYDISLEDGVLEVTKASLTITVDDKDKVYGSENPSLTFTYVGLVNGDTKVVTEPSITTTATVSSGVGTYPIILTGGSDANYDITLVSGIITVQKRVLVIQVDNLEKYVGEEDPTLTFAIISDSLLEGDVILGNLARETGEAIGVYFINIGSLSAGDNYELRIEGQPNFRINAFEEPKTLSIFEVIPIYLETEWGNENVVLDFPLNVMVKLSDNSLINLKVKWDLTNLDEYIFKRGQYKILGTIELEEGIINTEGVLAQLFLEVLPKDPPVQIRLNPNEFKVGNESYEKIQMIGEFTVIDPIDDVHIISLNRAELDNKYFQIQGGALYWNSEDPIPGKTSFQISVNVLDRDGNEINEMISINRIFAGLDEIEVKNTFTPNGDGINDDWGVIELRYYEKVKILVFEKSGKEVFETEDPNVFWDGTYKGKSLAIGTYFWIIEIGETGEVRKGMLNLLRK